MGDDSDPNVGLMSGCEQLLYTNVDHVVDGVERSGWQTMTQTAGLSDDDASTLYALIDPTLNPRDAPVRIPHGTGGGGS